MSAVAACGALSRAIRASVVSVSSIYTTIDKPPPIPELCWFTTPTHSTDVMAASTADPPSSKICLKIVTYIDNILKTTVISKMVRRRIGNCYWNRVYFGNCKC